MFLSRGAPLIRKFLVRTIALSSQHTQHDGTGDYKHQETQGSPKDEFNEESPTYENEEKEYEHNIKQRILKASLPHVHEFGWTKKSLEAGAKSEGLPPVAHGMFPRGGVEIVHYFYAKSNADLANILKEEVAQMEAEGLEKPKTGPFIQGAVQTRLQMILPYLDHWPQAMALQTLPQNAGESFTNLMNLVDDIWYYAGDRSVDFNWYTKRLTLAGVYKSTEIYMIQDKSIDQQDTWAFLNRRLDDLQTFGSLKKSLENSSDMLKEGLTGMCIMGRNILGMNSRNR